MNRGSYEIFHWFTNRPARGGGALGGDLGDFNRLGVKVLNRYGQHNQMVYPYDTGCVLCKQGDVKEDAMDLKRLGINKPGVYLIAREYGEVKGVQDVTDWPVDIVADAADCVTWFGRDVEIKRIVDVNPGSRG